MNAIICIDDIPKCTDVELLVDALKDATCNLLDDIMRIAAIVRRLDELGVSVELDGNLLPYIRMVGAGKLLGAALAGLYGEPLLLEQAVAADLETQRRLVDGALKVLMPDGSVNEKPAIEMSRREIRQVFKSGKVRSIEEQKHWLAGSANKRAALKAAHSAMRSRRCPECGALLVANATECVKCQADKHSVATTRLDEEDTNDECEVACGVMPDGWQDRMRQLRAVKQSGDELGFHVSWLMKRIEQYPEADARLAPLYRRLKELFETGRKL